MGAWPFMALQPARAPARRRPQLRRVSRPASAAPAVGSHKVHDDEQRQLRRAGASRG